MSNKKPPTKGTKQQTSSEPALASPGRRQEDASRKLGVNVRETTKTDNDEKPQKPKKISFLKEFKKHLKLRGLELVPDSNLKILYRIEKIKPPLACDRDSSGERRPQGDFGSE